MSSVTKNRGVEIAKTWPKPALSNIDPGACGAPHLLGSGTSCTRRANLEDAPPLSGSGHSESTKAHGLVRAGGHSWKGWPSAFEEEAKGARGAPGSNTPRHRMEGATPSENCIPKGNHAPGRTPVRVLG